MAIPLKLVAANDTVGALLALGEALAGKQAVFVTAPEVNGKMPETHGLPSEVDDAVALIVESSGSTGTPKRITLSRAALLASATAADAALGGPGQWLLALPINYIAGSNVLLRSLVAEQQPVLMNTQLPFTPDAFARAATLMTGERRYVSLVPLQLQRLVNNAAIDDFLLAELRRFDTILVGGQAADPALLAKAADLGLKIVRSYGSAETAGGCVYNGQPLADVAVRISTDGRVQISGPTLAESVADAEGWYTTNDLGEIDATGRLKISGRANRVINSGGLKVSLDAIEQAVLQIGGVVEAAAVAVTDAVWGERAVVVYVGSPEVADYIAADALRQLGAAAKPVRVVRVDALPRLTSGKPDYLSLQSQFAQPEV
jgi:O-succinylbenzoic acid--CoA ligase